MAITKSAGRQWPAVAKVDFTYADFAGNSAVALEAVDLPPGALLLSGRVDITTVFDSATSDVIDVGCIGSANATPDDDDKYTATPIDADAAATSVALTGIDHDDTFVAGGHITLMWTGVGAVPAQGAGTLVVEYIIDGKSNETQDR